MFFKLKIAYYLVNIKLLKWFYRGDFRRIQKIRSTSLMAHLKKSGFYKPMISKIVKISDFPVMNKQLFMQNFDRINTCKIKLSDAFKVAEEAERSRDFSPELNNVTVGLSTGTSGNRGVFLASENERAKWVAYMLDRVTGFSLKKNKVAFFLRANSNLYESTQSGLIQFNFFDVCINPVEHIERLNALQPDTLVAQPSMLCFLAEKIRGGELSVSPAKIISVAEVLTLEDKGYLEKIFNQPIHQVYQCTEGFLAATCKYGTLHFNEDFLIVEKKYVNREKTKFHPIITDTIRRSQPVVRYELNDIINEKTGCLCGNKMLAIESIEGRSDDTLRFINRGNEEVLLFPDVFRRAIVLADGRITDYCLIQSGHHLLKLYIKSEGQDSYKKVEKSLSALMGKYQIDNMNIIKLEQDPFVWGEKKRRVKNETR